MHDVSELTFIDFPVFKLLFLFQKLIIVDTIIIISWKICITYKFFEVCLSESLQLF